MFRLEPLDALGGGKVFRHGAAEFLDGLADFFADFQRGAVGGKFTADLVAGEFLFRLGGAEEAGGKFGAAHAIEDLLAFLETFAAVDGLGVQTTVEPHVAVILIDGVVDGFAAAAFSSDAGELGTGESISDASVLTGGLGVCVPRKRR
jgi:hypothetical protein